MLTIDGIDLQILEMLQANGRVAQNDLARSVGLSAPAVGERIRKLEERGVIRGYTAVLDPGALERDVAAFIQVGISGSRHFGEFRGRVADLPEVQECHSVTGQGSYLLKIRVPNTAALERLLSAVQSWPGVQWTTTSMVLSTLKETSQLGLPEPLKAQAERDHTTGPLGPAELLHVPFRHHP